jgi:hypothetical protein
MSLRLINWCPQHVFVNSVSGFINAEWDLAFILWISELVRSCHLNNFAVIEREILLLVEK